MKSYCPLIFYLLFRKTYKRPRPPAPSSIKRPYKKSKNLISTQGDSSDNYGKKINKFKNFVFKNKALRDAWLCHEKVYRSLILL